MPLSLRHLLPFANENRWADLLAVLIEADPASAPSMLGLPVGAAAVVARREVGEVAGDRLDLLVEADGVRVALVEAKVLSVLGPDQLNRYQASFPDVPHRVVLFPATLLIDLTGQPTWQPLTW